jgi:hypothetical protein
MAAAQAKNTRPAPAAVMQLVVKDAAAAFRRRKSAVSEISIPATNRPLRIRSLPAMASP